MDFFQSLGRQSARSVERAQLETEAPAAAVYRHRGCSRLKNICLQIGWDYLRRDAPGSVGGGGLGLTPSLILLAQALLVRRGSRTGLGSLGQLGCGELPWFGWKDVPRVEGSVGTNRLKITFL